MNPKKRFLKNLIMFCASWLFFPLWLFAIVEWAFLDWFNYDDNYDNTHDLVKVFKNSLLFRYQR